MYWMEMLQRQSVPTVNITKMVPHFVYRIVLIKLDFLDQIDLFDFFSILDNLIRNNM